MTFINNLKTIQLLGSYISFELDTAGRNHVVLTEDYIDTFSEEERNGHKACLDELNVFVATLEIVSQFR